MKMKAHLTFSSNPTDQPLPEHDGQKSLHYHGSSSSENSCTASLNEQDEDNSQGGFVYPADLLGTSWGSYLYSGPPTRSGLKGVIKQSEAVETKPDQSITTVLRKSSAKSNGKEMTDFMLEAHPKAFMGATKDLTQISENVSSSDEVVCDKRSQALDCQSNPPTARKQRYPLFGKVQGLVKIINTANETITKCGVNTNKLNTLKLCSKLEQLVSDGPICEDVPLVYCEVTDCLTEVFQGLIEQSKMIQREASFIQRTGKKLNKAQEQFFKEQNELQRALEEARTQLDIEKQMLQVEKTAVKKNKEELKRIYDSGQKGAQTVCEPKPSPKRTLAQKSVHEVMQDRNHLMAVVQTRTEQNRLEKLLVTQQREIQQVQKELQFIKTELALTQDHALKLEHKLAMYKSKASTLTSQNLDDNSVKGHKKPAEMTGKTGSLRLPRIHGIVTAQKTLDREIKRVQRQHDKQQVKEKEITKQLEASCKRLRKTNRNILKEQAGKMKGRYIHDETSSHSLSRPELSHQQSQPRMSETLGQLDRVSPSQSTSITYLPKLVPDTRGQRVTTNKFPPTFEFSKTELVTLAHFSDKETADSVIEWLGLL